VSSLAVLEEPDHGGAVDEDAILAADSRSNGPYAWGKAASERLALETGDASGVDVRVVRPGAIVDYESFDPPGRLGKRVGNVFVAVGKGGDKLGVVDLGFAADTLAWIATNCERAPETLNLIQPDQPTKKRLVGRLRQMNPDLAVIWLPMPVLRSLSWLALGLQKVLRPGRPAVNAAEVFRPRTYDAGRIASLAPLILAEGSGAAGPTERDLKPATPVFSGSN
jgi:nucleoside-diphosphate-sugar epimerase